MSKPIRVLELRSVFGTGGGPDKTIVASGQLSNSDVELTLCYLRHENDTIFPVGDLARSLGLDYVEIKERHSLDPKIWPTLVEIVRSKNIDIVHGHEYKTDLLAYLLARFHGVLPFATAHGWTGHSRRERWMYYPADKRLLARFPVVVAVSSQIKDELVATGSDPRRVTVILNGIDAERFRRDRQSEAAARQTLGVRENELVIGSVGRLEPQKRFDLLIEAFAGIRAAYPNARLLIAGDGSLRQALESQIRNLGLEQSVGLVGHVDVVPFHHAIDLFVQSSAYEGTPNVVLEAMAMETPIVATDVGGTAELAHHNEHACIVKPGDLVQLREAILTTLGDPQSRAERVRRARLRVEDELSFAKRIARLNALYVGLAETRKRKTS